MRMMLQEGKVQVVRCGDLNCKLCTASRPGDTAASNDTATAYVVYTCESPMCSLCREEPDVLLDLFCPFNSIQDIKEIARKMSNITGMETYEDEMKGFLAGDTRGSSPSAQEPRWWCDENNSYSGMKARLNDGSNTLRELLQSVPPAVAGTRSNESELDTAQNLIDETCLMDLALEFQVDKLNDLPELREEGLIEFI